MKGGYKGGGWVKSGEVRDNGRSRTVVWQGQKIPL